MYSGQSGWQGILIQDTTKNEHEDTVYGYYKDNELIIQKGARKDLDAIQRKSDEMYENKSPIYTKLMIILFIGMLIAVIFSFLHFKLLTAFSILFFCILGYMPILSILFLPIKDYDTEEAFHSFRKNHAAEHAAISLLTKIRFYNGKPTMEALKQQSIYSQECGTVYSGMALIFISILSCVINQVMVLGILKALGILLLSVVLLIILFVLPFNPLRYLQHTNIEKPTEREYQLALTLIRALTEKNEPLCDNITEENGEN